MKFRILSLVFICTAIFTSNVQAQMAAKNHEEVRTIQLEQTPGAFTIQSLSLSEGTYQFEIVNNGVDHEVGFVLVPQGKTEAADHIKSAYVTSPVKPGSKSSSQHVSLSKGTYEYFCPLNPTPKYTIIVE